MSSAVIQLLVLGGIAIFLIMRLRSVLGTREGFEKAPVAIPAPDVRRSVREFEVIDGGPDRDITDHAPDGSDSARALTAMKQAEPGFSVSEFLQGARSAYEMILTAFDKGEIDRIRPFLSPGVASGFAEVIAERAAKGITVETQFMGLRELALTEAEFDRTSTEAEITVRFVGELISVIRDSGGTVIDGGPKQTRKQRDVWTFGRKMGASDPNWRLVATGA